MPIPLADPSLSPYFARHAPSIKSRILRLLGAAFLKILASSCRYAFSAKFMHSVLAECILFRDASVCVQRRPSSGNGPAQDEVGLTASRAESYRPRASWI